MKHQINKNNTDMTVETKIASYSIGNYIVEIAATYICPDFGTPTTTTLMRFGNVFHNEKKAQEFTKSKVFTQTFKMFEKNAEQLVNVKTY